MPRLSCPCQTMGRPGNHVALVQNNLRIHKIYGRDGVIYSCDQCQYQCRRKDSPKNHIWNVHNDEKYNCDKCQYQATKQSNLILHRLPVHEGVKYKCDQCQYWATT